MKRKQIYQTNTMYEAKAESVLKSFCKIIEDASLDQGKEYVCWDADEDLVSLDGHFTLAQVQALAWWMEHKSWA